MTATVRRSLVLLAAVASLAAGGFAQAALDARARPTLLRGFAALRAKVRSGASVRVTYVGGSVTHGGTTSPRVGVGPNGPYDYSSYSSLDDCWRALCNRQLNLTLGNYTGQFVEDNHSLGATGSELVAYRYAEYIGPTDLLLCEFAINDVQLMSATANGVDADRSVYRTLTSVVQQARAANPNVAIAFVIGPRRDPNAGPGYILSRERALRFANDFEIARIDLVPAFFEQPIPAGFDATRLFDGPDTGSNSTHPAPEGHRYYAKVVADALAALINWPYMVFEHAEPLPHDLLPYPVAPDLLDATELAALPSADGWQARPSLEDFAQHPFYADRLVLFATSSGVELTVPFDGTAVGVWWEWLYNGQSINGTIQFWVDGQDLGIYTPTGAGPAFPIRRFIPLADGLDARMPHELRIQVQDPHAGDPVVRLGLNAVLVGH